jgi:hypothetical protein
MTRVHVADAGLDALEVAGAARGEYELRLLR